MPPIVGVHEGVAALPGVGHLTQEGDSLQHLAARFQAMGDGVVRPRIAAVHRQRAAGRGLGLLDAVALLQAERMHGVDVAVLRVGGEQALADAQQRLGVAVVEGMELAQLAGQEVARPFGGHLLVDFQAAVGLAGDPGLGRGDPGALAGVGILPPVLSVLARARYRLAASPAFGRVHGQDEVGRHHRQQRAAFFLVGGGDELGEPVAEAQPLLAEEIERGDRLRAGVAHVQSLTVPRQVCPLDSVGRASHDVSRWAKDEKTRRRKE